MNWLEGETTEPREHEWWVLGALKVAATLTLPNVRVQSSGGSGGKLSPYTFQRLSSKFSPLRLRQSRIT